MYHLVGYFTHPSGARLRALQRCFGTDLDLTVRPLVSPAFGSLEDAVTSKEELEAAYVCAVHESVLIQPGEAEIPPMSERQAVQLLTRHEAWNEFVGGDNLSSLEVTISAKELPRCWVLAATLPQPTIPPGEAFVVDKHSKQVFPRRYIDAMSLFTPGP